MNAPRFGALFLVLVLAASARAFTVNEVKTLVATGCQVTVDKRFSKEDIAVVVAQGGGRITVICAGLELEDARTYLGAGAIIVPDGAYGVQNILALARLGGRRVRVDPATLSPEVVKQAQAAGALVLAGPGGAGVEEKMETLRHGGQCVVDSSMSVRDTANLIAAGRTRVHVIATGIAMANLRMYAQAGAMVWLDPSFKPEEVVALAQIGGDRIVVRAAGFALKDLESFARARAHICFAFDRAHARETTFEKIFGKQED